MPPAPEASEQLNTVPVLLPKSANIPAPPDMRQLRRPEQINLRSLPITEIVNAIPKPPEGENKIVMDFGCGRGVRGKAVAAESGAQIIQADIFDMRTQENKTGSFSLLPRDTPPALEGNAKLSAVLMTDVLQHVSYKDHSQEEAILALINGIQPALQEGGKIIITTTHDSGRALANNEVLWESVETTHPGVVERITTRGLQAGKQESPALKTI